MAKKARTPPPPPRPRQQGPRRRDTRGPRRPLGLDRRGLLAGIAVGAVVAAVILVVVLTRGGGGGGGAALSASELSTIRAAGCSVITRPPLPPTHDANFHADSPTLTTKVRWSTFPPSAGGHYATPAVWGFYRQPVNPRQVVHNEEHGGLIIWWGERVPAATVSKLEAFYNESPVSVLGTPIQGLDSKVALTAWTGDPSRYTRNGYYGVGHVMTCTRFDEKAFALFRDAFRGKGPEGVPMEANRPGT
ncbi:MAG TPA: DUF3105 domain-containing protein [Gaiellaceae bacterium]|nr:DUF3105 domain-containing protein [Gaiellaceae bacterium]